MARQEEKMEGLIFAGGNVKLLAVKVKNELYDALEMRAEAEKLPLPELIRRYLQFVVFPDLITSYIANFTEALKKTDLMSPEEASKVIELCERFWDSVLREFESVKPIEAKAKGLRATNKLAQKELLKNYAKMMEAWKLSRREVDKQTKA